MLLLASYRGDRPSVSVKFVCPVLHLMTYVR